MPKDIILPSSGQIAGVVATLVVAGILYALRNGAAGKNRSLLTYATLAFVATGAIYWAGTIAPGLERGVSVLKACIGLGALSALGFEAYRSAQRRPVSPRFVKFVGLALAFASLCLYFNGFRGGYAKFWHRHDQYHYYLGAKYYRELGYDELYRCTAVAMDQLGSQTETIDGKAITLDMRAEVRAPDKKIRNLGADNLLKPSTDFLANAGMCDPAQKAEEGTQQSRFSPERWEAFKKDIRFFRFSTAPNEKDYWDGFQRDHGYNPPPVWTLMGYFVSNLREASLGFMQFLGAIDFVYIALSFAAIAWAFGWRTFALAAIIFGCAAPAQAKWTYGALLRQDWLFFLVLATCLAKKKYFFGSGLAISYATLLRIFPGLVGIGWVLMFFSHLVFKKKLDKDLLKAFAGAAVGGILLVGASTAILGKNVYPDFYRHTLQVHDQTPLTNHMGLRVIIGHRVECIIPKVCDEKASGRMQFVKEADAIDPFQTWKSMRLERYAKYKYVGYAFSLAVMAAFVLVVRRIKALWIVTCLSQVFIILFSQLTCYYYAFLMLLAPLGQVRPKVERTMVGFVALSQVGELLLGYIDDRYTVLTILSLGLCIQLLLELAPPHWFDKLRELGLMKRDEPPPPPTAT